MRQIIRAHWIVCVCVCVCACVFSADFSAWRVSATSKSHMSEPQHDFPEGCRSAGIVFV